MKKKAKGNISVKKPRMAAFITYAIVVAILLFALFVRRNTFWLEHWQGDQSQYITLAMKLDKFGLDHYNLRGVKIRFVLFKAVDTMRLAYVTPSEDLKEKGDILKGLEWFGVDYYDMPLYYKAPAFPYALVLSHKLFAKPTQPYTVAWTKARDYLWQVRPRVFFDAQFYAVIVPLFFSLGSVVCSFFLGKVLFSARVGLYAAFMMAMNPVSIFNSQKLLSDDMVSFFVALLMLLFAIAVQNNDNKRKHDICIVAAGLSCGVAILAKQTAGLAIIGVWVFTVLTHPKKLWEVRSLPRIVCNKRFVLFSVAALLVSGFWFLKVYQVYGHPLARTGSAAFDRTGWNSLLRGRPNGWILYLIGLPYLCPPFAFVFFSMKRFLIETYHALVKKTYDYRFIFLWVSIITFAYYFRGAAGQEERRMMPVYPCIAVLASYCLDRLRVYTGKYSVLLPKTRIREIAIIVFLLVCAAWSVPIAINAAVNLKMLLRVPF